MIASPVQTTSNALDEVFDFLLSQPTLEQVAAFQVSPQTQERVAYLLSQNREGLLTPDERRELDELSKINHFMALLKAHAHLSLQELREPA
jgi:hypothetical protein